MDSLNKQTVKALGEEMAAALQVVAQRHGIEITRSGGTFADLEATLKFTVRLTSATGETQAALDWKANADILHDLYNIKADWLGQTFESGGRTYTVSGFIPKRPSKCIEITRDDGKALITTPENIKRCMVFATAGKA
jgi:hypothetical protein